ncbi:ArsR/SmtB family transcription factor [Altererythrobacter ishigakiensis]|uniref:DNA-binding transcriptional ArsR family regulator n=1 Tax=Altererythrobacter ishigakiensis TaxID=476157 RepID=A0A562ULZ3_9SPHN|nr:metalloregulator ArsR/SmtB family transcription factor [Altererythrobacter ishigakiensis]TWJ06630.1 DNA-binding transcriptional ArsR family regulator [Altererythrobacter ishigakiensis]
MTDDAPIEELKAIAHPLRFQIVQLLRGGELNVGEIETASGIGQPALSQQLGVLRKAELVETRKDAKLVYYTLNEDRLVELGTLIGGLDPRATAKNVPARTPAPGVANFARLS